MPLRVRYVECDMQGRVFNGHYLTWFDMAINEAVRDIFGDYASAGGEAGAVKSAEGTVVSKGEVNLALSGTGRGWDLGVSFNKFSIQPLEAK